MKRCVFDTNILVDWMNTGAHERVILGGDRVRLLSAIVEMELRVGATGRKAKAAVDRLARAFRGTARLLLPSAQVYSDAGVVLQKLARRGFEIRRASLVNDVLIALSARSIGAWVVTRDSDFEAIAKIVSFPLELV